MGTQLTFTKQECASLRLLQNDLRFVFMIASNYNRFGSNYIASSLPYIGVIVDGAEDWISAYNRSHKNGISVPTFTPEEEDFYSKMRSSIKLWNTSYDEIYRKLEAAYIESDAFFRAFASRLPNN